MFRTVSLPRFGLLHLFLLLAPTLAHPQSWISNGPYAKNIRSITISPSNTNIIFAGAFGWGVFKSTNAGLTWVNMKSGLTNTYVRSVVALSDNIIFAGTNDGVFKTTNGGSTWVNALTTTRSVRGLSYDPKTDVVYAATYGSGLYKTTDRGTAWTHVTVSDPSVGETMNRLWSVENYGRDSIYVGGSLLDIVAGGALFKSINGGTTWSQVQDGTALGIIRSSIHSIGISQNDAAHSLIVGTASLGVYKSTDGGNSWLQINGSTTPNPIVDKRINAVNFSADFRYAGSDSLGKFYYRALGDVSVGWKSGTGLPGVQAVINAIDLDPLNKSIVYVGTEGEGCYVSSDSGKSWMSRNSGMMGTAGRAIRLNGNGNLILGTEFGDGIWISTDRGNSWAKTDSLPTSNSITSIGITNDSSILYSSDYGNGVYKSTDGGHVWHITDSTVINQFVRTLAVHPTNPSIVYAGTGNGIFKTSNGGNSWFAVNAGVPIGTSVRSLEIDPNSPNILYAGTATDYLYKSTNDGVSWTHITNTNGFLTQDQFIRCIAVDKVLPEIVYVGSDSGRIYRSSNAGVNWSLLSQFPSIHSVRSVRIDPRYRKRLFAATFGDGIFVSVDSGIHWSAMNAGLVDTEFYSLETDASTPLNIYAGSGSHGVFHTTYLNRVPKLDFIGKKVVLTGHELTIFISATDSDFTIPTLSARGLPLAAFFYDSSNGHAIFKWTPSNAQIGEYVITFLASDGIASDSLHVAVSVLDSTTAKVVNIPIESGWNLLSAPLLVNDFRKNAVFPSSQSSAFSFQGSYVSSDTLTLGKGYWLKFPFAQTVQVGGSSITRDTISVMAKWNIIGTLVPYMRSSAIVPVPPENILSAFFGYSSLLGYFRVDTLRAGSAYWVKVSADGKLVLNSGSMSLSALQRNDASRDPDLAESQLPSDLEPIDFVEARGNHRTLYFASNPSSQELAAAELPPLPPGNIFDLRFASQRVLEPLITEGHARDLKVDITGGEYPISTRWKFHNTDVLRFLNLSYLDGSIERFELSGEGRLQIQKPSLAHVSISIVPKTPRKVTSYSYRIAQNYPNPFNPVTTIRYSLSNPSYVSLKILNVLGAELGSLVAGIQESGEHTVTWDAGAHASGVYFFSLSATDPLTGKVLFREVKKMLLAK